MKTKKIVSSPETTIKGLKRHMRRVNAAMGAAVRRAMREDSTQPAASKKTVTMAKRRLKQSQRPVKENPPHFWVNCRVREDHHQHQCAAYVLVHEASGRFFIDATASFYSHMQFQEQSLQGGLHYSTEMQRLYNQSPRFVLHYEVIGGDDSNGLNRLEAEELKQMWLTAFATDDKLINSKSEAIGYQAMGMRRPVRVEGVEYPNVKTAARQLGVTEKTVTNRCNSSKKPEWVWL